MVTEKALLAYLSRRSGMNLSSVRKSVGYWWCSFCGSRAPYIASLKQHGSAVHFCANLVACEKRATDQTAIRSKVAAKFLAEITLPGDSADTDIDILHVTLSRSRADPEWWLSEYAPDIGSQGKTVAEALRNLADAIELNEEVKDA